MSPFNRKLDDDFVEALNCEYKKEEGWSKRFVDDTELFLAIRENEVHVYCRGSGYCNSSGSMSEASSIPNICPKVCLGAGNLQENDLRFLDIQELKCRAKGNHANKNKKGKSDVHNIILANPRNILNFEINVIGSGSQIDFSTPFDGGLRFYEAKIAGIRARSDQNLAAQRESLPVVYQICHYANLM